MSSEAERLNALTKRIIGAAIDVHKKLGPGLRAPRAPRLLTRSEPLTMQSAISTRALLRPSSLDEALKMLRDDGPLVPMAGCTDLYVALNFGALADTRFLDLWRLDTLKTIEERDGVLSIGALATHTDLIRSALVRRRLPMLAAAAPRIRGGPVPN